MIYGTAGARASGNNPLESATKLGRSPIKVPSIWPSKTTVINKQAFIIVPVISCW